MLFVVCNYELPYHKTVIKLKSLQRNGSDRIDRRQISLVFNNSYQYHMCSNKYRSPVEATGW
jgi:hypothetical protein